MKKDTANGKSPRAFNRSAYKYHHHYSTVQIIVKHNPKDCQFFINWLLFFVSFYAKMIDERKCVKGGAIDEGQHRDCVEKLK